MSNFSEVKSFDGQAHSTVGPYRAYIPHSSDITIPASVDYSTRFGQRPIRNSLTVQPREIPFIVTAGTGGAENLFTWWENVRRIYHPYSGERLLIAEHEGVDLYRYADVVALTMDANEPFLAYGTFSSSDGIWTAVSAGSAVTSSPITPGGNSDAFPLLTITPTGTNVNYRVITVTPNNDEGLTDYPVRIGGGSLDGGALALNTVSAPAAADYMVFVDGQPVPFLVQGYNTATGKLDVTISGKPGEAVPVLLFYGTNIDNTTFAQQFQSGGLKLDHASYSNGIIVYRTVPATLEGAEHPSWMDAQKAIVRPLSFHPSMAAAGSTTQATLAGIDGGTYYRLQVGGGGPSALSYAAVLPIPAAAADGTGHSGASIGGLQYLKGYDDALAYTWDWLWYRRRDYAYFDLEPPSAFADQDVHDIEDATLILLKATGVFRYQVLKHSDSTQQDMILTLKTATLPTVSIGAAQVGHRLNMDITTPRSVIQIRDVYTANVALVIDTLNQDIAPASGDVLYYGPGGGITFTARDEWVPLTAGVANAYSVTNLGGSAVSLSWSVPARYAL